MPSKFWWNCLRARRTALSLFLSVPLGATAQGVIQGLQQRETACREDRLLVIPKRDKGEAISRLNTQSGVKVFKALLRTANIHVLEMPKGVLARDLITRYRQSGHFEVVEPDQLVQLAGAPDDPGFTSGDQWYLQNTGQGGGVVDADIDAPEAWDTLNSASNIIVAVLDSGVRQTHEDLAPNLWVNPGEIAGNGLDDDGNGYIDDVHGIDLVANPDTGNPNDDYGHGTHVAGILGAVGNNGLGTCGTAWRVQVMACRFLTATAGSLSDAIICLDYARAKGAHVVNCSFVAPGFNAALSNAFWAVRNDGIIVVAAAGNTGANNDLSPQFPASFKIDNVIAVTATTRTDGQIYNYGATSVHLGAPGHSILSTFYRSDADYGYMSGTSMAAPCVAGAVALLRARFPTFTHQQIISRLLSTTEPLLSLTGKCITGGRLNLARALGPANFTIQPALFDWVATNGMTPITLGNDGVSGARPLPFTFRFYGQDYQQIHIGANGLIGFTNSGLNLPDNADLPGATLPNAIVCPLWDDLDPSLGGNVWTGVIGFPPNRKLVVSWVNVPHSITTGGQTTRFTFQAILHETRQITFHYLQVQTGKSTLVSGKNATIGVEDDTGLLAAKYSFNPGSVAVTNNQAVLFSTQTDAAAPSLTCTPGPQPGQVQLQMFGEPGRVSVLSASDDLDMWTALATNMTPATGRLSFIDANAGGSHQKFYRATVVQ